ncbi:hypothetical protein LSAT2_017669, partial [Lamellibrachia satsuma]
MAAAAADGAVAATGADWFGFVFPTGHEVVVCVCVRRPNDWRVVFSPSVVCHQAGGRREEGGRKAGGRRTKHRPCQQSTKVDSSPNTYY